MKARIREEKCSSDQKLHLALKKSEARQTALKHEFKHDIRPIIGKKITMMFVSISAINNPLSDDCQLYRASAAVESKSAPVP